MSYCKEDLQAVRALLRSRRAEAVATYEAHRAEASAAIPAIIPVEQSLASTGSRIMSAALSHGLDGESLADIRAENERLRALRRRLLTSAGYPEDWLDIKYSCPACSDTGYVGINMCTCMKRELVMAAFRSSGLASLLETQSFGTFSTDFYTGEDRRRIETNVKLLREFAEGFSGSGSDSWLLLGATGLGKTHLSTSVARVVIERGYSVVYESAQGIISDFESKRFGGDYLSRRDERYFDCDLLIIDDLGVEISNQFTVSCIYNIINDRINNGKSTIINTNLSQSELRSRYADRITSRLFGEFRPLLFTGNDIRGQKIKK